MRSGVTITTDRENEVKRWLKGLTQECVLVGIPAEKADRKPDPNEPDSPITNAEIGYLNEFGAPEQNLPARPHLVPGIQRVLPKIAEVYEKAVGDTALNGPEAARKAHVKVGMIATASVKNYIAEGLSPTLAESTLAARKRAGKTRTNPLQDTGQYRNAIDFVVAPKSGVKRRR